MHTLYIKSHFTTKLLHSFPKYETILTEYRTVLESTGNIYSNIKNNLLIQL